MTAPSDTPDAPDVVPGGPAIEANDLTYRYAKRDEPALAGLTLTLRPAPSPACWAATARARRPCCRSLPVCAAPPPGGSRLRGAPPSTTTPP